MRYEWAVRRATTAYRQPAYEPPQLDDVLEGLEADGWEIHGIFLVAATTHDTQAGAPYGRFHVVARRPVPNP
jgi:hypothetical protein